MSRNFVDYKQVAKDFLKRQCIDFIRKGNRLQTPMQIQINTLRCYGYLPQRIIAVELFGMHGLWIVKDYADICTYLELWEINHVYATFAKEFIKKAVVVEGDSIRAVLDRKLMRDRYNLIVSDNPMGSPYGDNYYEHFDLFPSVLDYMDDRGVIQLNFIHNPILLSDKHMQKRETFYGKAKPTIAEAADIYGKLIANRERILEDVLFLPRNDRIGFLTLIIRGERPLK